MPNVFQRIALQRGEAQAAQAQTPPPRKVSTGARDNRRTMVRKLIIANALNLRRRGSGGGFGLFSSMFTFGNEMLPFIQGFMPPGGGGPGGPGGGGQFRGITPGPGVPGDPSDITPGPGGGGVGA